MWLCFNSRPDTCLRWQRKHQGVSSVRVGSPTSTRLSLYAAQRAKPGMSINFWTWIISEQCYRLVQLHAWGKFSQQCNRTLGQKRRRTMRFLLFKCKSWRIFIWSISCSKWHSKELMSIHLKNRASKLQCSNWSSFLHWMISFRTLSRSMKSDFSAKDQVSFVIKLWTSF